MGSKPHLKDWKTLQKRHPHLFDNSINVPQASISRRLQELKVFRESLLERASLREQLNIPNKMTLDEDLQKEIAKLNLTPQEVSKILKNLRNTNPNRFDNVKVPLTDNHLKFGVISDLHIGHMNYRWDVMRHAADQFREQDVQFIVNAGDTLEGMSNREGHVFELAHVGISAQLDYFEKEFKKLAQWDVYSIEAQDSHGGWAHNKGNQGLNIGEEMERRVPNYKFIGYDEQDLVLDNGFKIRLVHPGGGTAYAISYKMQKYVNSLGGGDKPNMIFQGHYHKMMYMYYRNIHCFEAGTLENQSPFMKKKGTPAMIGYWIIDVQFDKKGGVGSITPQMFPFYD